jgi:hypothetical protein
MSRPLGPILNQIVSFRILAPIGDLFPSGFLTIILCVFLIASMSATCPTHLICNMLSELSFGRTETNYDKRSSGKVLIKQIFVSVFTKKNSTATQKQQRYTTQYRCHSAYSTYPTLVQASQQIGILAVMGWDCRLSTTALDLLYYPRVIAMLASE